MFILEAVISFIGKFIFPPNFFVIDPDLSDIEVMCYLGTAAEF